jgi:hypothetical protein
LTNSTFTIFSSGENKRHYLAKNMNPKMQPDISKIPTQEDLFGNSNAAINE